MKKISMTDKKLIKKGQFWSFSEKKTFIIIGLVLLGLLLLYYGLIISSKLENENAYKAFIGKEIPDSMVCMISGVVKPKAIKPIIVNERTYWGCCNKCIAKLTNNIGNVHFSLDPYTNEKINKTDAIIRLNPKYKKKALFFVSNKTYHQYIKLINETK